MLENLSFKEKKKKKKFVVFYFSMICLIHYYVFNILQGYMTSIRLLMKLDGWNLIVICNKQDEGLGFWVTKDYYK